MGEAWRLSDLHLDETQSRRYEVGVIPIAAIEPHNVHLPCGCDFYVTTAIAERCCAEAWGRKAAVWCLPTIPYGVDCNLMDFPGAMHVSQDTLNRLLRDLVESLCRHGVRKVVLLNGHGGNDFGAFIRQVQADDDVHLFLCDWWRVGHDRYEEIFSAADDHGGEMETSVVMSLFPGMVDLTRAKDGHVRPFRLEALRKGWVRTSRRFARLNDHCAAGDPRGATAEKGKRYLDLVCERISTFLVELAAAETDAFFPQEITNKDTLS